MQLLTGIDLIFFVVVILSSLMAYFHGLTYEFFSVVAWVGASFAALYGLEYIQPYVAELVGGSQNWVSATITAGIIFAVSFVILSLCSHHFSRMVKASDFKTADKSLGVIFGILRGLVLMGIFFLIYIWINPTEAEQGDLLKKTRMLPVIKISARVVKDLLPEKMRVIFKNDIFEDDDAADAYKKLSRPTAKKEPAKDQKPHGYSETVSRDLEKLIHMSEGVALSPEEQKDLGELVQNIDQPEPKL